MKTIKTLLSAAAFTTLTAAASFSAAESTKTTQGTSGPSDQLPAQPDDRTVEFIAAWEQSLPSTDLNGDGGFDSADLQLFFHSVQFPRSTADFKPDGVINGADLQLFVIGWTAGDDAADLNQDGGIDQGDLETWFLCSASVNIDNIDWTKESNDPGN